MSDNKQGVPQNIDPAVMKQLLAAMQAKQQPAMTPRQAIMMKLTQKIGQKIQVIVHNLDRFVNFVAKPDDHDRNEVLQSARAPILFGTYVIIIFFVFGGLWSALAPLDSAAIAPGTVMSSTNRKILNTQEGGVIKHIYVEQGDHVKQGDPIIAFDEVRAKGLYEARLNNYRTALAAESRLIAERDHLPEIEFSEILLKDANNSEVQKILHTQQHLFESRMEAFNGKIESNSKVLNQLSKEIESLEARKVSAIKNYSVITSRVKSAKELMHKGYLSNAGMMELEGKQAEIKSVVSSTEAQIAKQEQAIAQQKIDTINFQNQFMSEILKELKETQTNLATSREEYLMAKNALEHAVVTSPVDGVVNVLKFHTVGSVVPSGGQTIIAEISPSNDKLIIEARISPKNIDSVRVGLEAKIRFSAFKSRTTPMFNGKVVAISPDVVIDPSGPQIQQEAVYYAARIELNMEEFDKVAKERHIELHPGMQAEVQIITGTRTLFKYLLDPVTDTMFNALKEK